MASRSAGLSRMNGRISRLPWLIFQSACHEPSTKVDADEVLPEVAGQVAAQQGLVQGAEADVIRGVHQVDRVTHQVGAKHGPFGQKIFQGLVTEAGQPRPQPDVRGQRGLSLQVGQVADRVPRRHRGPVEQQLAVQRGAVQRAQAQAVRGHARAAAVSSSAG